VGYEGIRKSVLTWQGLRWGSRRWCAGGFGAERRGN